MRAVLTTIAATLVAMVAAVASPFDDADSAFGGSNYGITMQRWFPNGVAEAQHRFLVEGQRRLATRYYLGEGTPQDYVEAAKWYQLAAEQGSSSGTV